MRGVEVFKDARLAHQFAIDHHGEVNVENDFVVDREAEYDAYEHILSVVLKRRRVEPERSGLLGEREHTCTRQIKRSHAHYVSSGF